MYNYESTKFHRTFDIYDHGDCYNFLNIHDYIKHIKTGHTKVTDQASREIRHGRISKEEATKLVNFYETQLYQYDDLFYEWLGVKKNSFQFVLNQFYNKKYWLEVEPGKWITKKKITVVPAELNNIYGARFQANSSMNRDKPSKYITVGKGYP